MKDIRDEIRAEIAEHQAAIDKLKIGLEVVESFMGWKAPSAAKPIQAAQVIDQPMLTVRRIKPEKAPEKKTRAKRSGPGEYASITERVRAFFDADPAPCKSGTVIEALGGRGHEVVTANIYRAMSYLKSSGKIARTDDGFYSLVKAPDEASNAQEAA